MILFQCLLLSVAIFLVLCLYTLHQSGKAAEWFSCYENERRFKKHFGRENVISWVNHRDRVVTFVFSVRSVTHEKSVTFVEAIKIMNKTINGGVRKRLHKLL